MAPEDLACPLLRVIDSLPGNLRHLHNYLLSEAASGYEQKYADQVKEAQRDAWES